MKRFFLCRILLVMMVVGNLILYFSLSIIKDNTIEIMDFLTDHGLLGVDGDFYLIGVKEEKNHLLKELSDLVGRDQFDIQNSVHEIDSYMNQNIDLREEIMSISSNVSNQVNQKNALSSQYEVLNQKYLQLKRVVNAKKYSNNSFSFPLINQYPKYPTGCESVALTMLLRYYGVDVTPDLVINTLRKGSLPYYENGILYGGNPELEFVGNPFSSGGYGAFEKPIGEVANTYKSGAIVRNNVPFEEVIELVQNNRPVEVWVSIGLAVPYLASEWIYKNTMEKVYWRAPEHALIVLAVHDEMVTVADPIGGSIKNYSKNVFVQRYNYFGRKVVYY